MGWYTLFKYAPRYVIQIPIHKLKFMKALSFLSIKLAFYLSPKKRDRDQIFCDKITIKKFPIDSSFIIQGFNFSVFFLLLSQKLHSYTFMASHLIAHRTRIFLISVSVLLIQWTNSLLLHWKKPSNSLFHQPPLNRLVRNWLRSSSLLLMPSLPSFTSCNTAPRIKSSNLLLLRPESSC